MVDKICSICKIPKTFENFTKRTSQKDGYCTQCKLCCKQYRLDNKVRIARYKAEWAKSTDGKKRKKITDTLYLQTEKGRNFNRKNNAKKRLRRKFSKVSGSFSPEELKVLLNFSMYSCEFCGIDVKENYQLDHLTPISKSGSNLITNIAISCKSCNCSKGSKNLKSFSQDLLPYFHKRNLVVFSSASDL